MTIVDTEETYHHDYIPPPPYTAVTATQLIDSSTDVRGDGRIDVNLDSKLGYALSRLIQSPPDYSTLTPALPPRPRHTKWTIKLNIVMQVVGSRGDVQPFIALGNELQKHGHRVRLATHSTFRTFVQSHNLEFYPLGGDPEGLMSYMVRNGGLLPKMKSLKEGEIQRKRHMIAEILDGCWNSCIEADPDTGRPFVADAIIANPPSFGHVHCAQALGVPVHIFFTMPWTPTKRYPHPLANLKFTNETMDQRMANYVSYVIVEWMTWQALGDIVNKWRHSLDLEPISMMNGPNLVDALKIPFTYCWSPALVPKPLDWPAHIDICGFFFRDPPAYTPSPALAEFLDRGQPPIYIGFGSIVIDDPEKLTSILLQAVERCGIRAVISRGWSKLGGGEGEGGGGGMLEQQQQRRKDVFWIDDVPHEWLFQRVSAVVHHGGAGTTACGLLNGKPTCIVPFFGDQPFWGSMVASTGAGPLPIPYKSLNPLILAEAIQYCLTGTAITAATTLSSKMKTESGVKAAVDSFHAHLPLERMACDLVPDLPAAWEYQYRTRTKDKGSRDKGKEDGDGAKKKTLKLSKVAAEVLAEYMRIERHRLVLYETAPLIIDPRHYDPVSSSVGVILGSTTKTLKAGSDIFTKPYSEYKRGQQQQQQQQQQQEASSSSSSGVSASSSASTSTSTSTSTARGNDDVSSLVSENSSITTSTNNKNSAAWVTAGAMAGASAKSLGMMNVTLVKILLVDVPLACAEGFKAVPALYGDPVRDHGRVTDWKSGAVVGGKSFVYNMVEGMSDIVVLPHKARKEDLGGLEVAKAVGKGTVSLVTKPAAGAFGVIAYPFQGITKSISSLVRTKTRNRIAAAKHLEGEYLLRRSSSSSSSSSGPTATADDQIAGADSGNGVVVVVVEHRVVLETFEAIRGRREFRY